MKNVKPRLLLITRLTSKHLLVVCFIFVMTVWTIRLASLYYGPTSTGLNGSLYTSDAVAQQVILKDWQKGYRQSAVVGQDNWIIKYPLYIVTNNLPISANYRILTTSWLILATTAVLIMWSLQRFMSTIGSVGRRKKQLSLLALSAFIAAIPATTFFIFQFPNSRNIEIGLAMFLMVELHRFFVSKRIYQTHTYLKIAVAFLAFSLLLADDPLFLYEFGLPLLFIAATYFIFLPQASRWKVYVIGGFAGLSIIASKLITHALTLLTPLSYIKPQTAFASFDQFIVNLKYLFNNAIDIFGIDFWGKESFKLHTILVYVFIIIFAVSVYGFILQTRSYKNSIIHGLSVTIGVAAVAIFCLNTLFGSGLDNLSGRYLIILIPVQLFALSYALLKINNKRLNGFIVLCMVSAVMLTVIFSVKTIATNFHEPVNNIDQSVLSVIKKANLSKGYAAYSRSTTLTYSSDFKVNVVSVECGPQDKKMYFSPVLSEEGALRQPVQKSFYLYDPTRPHDCQAEDLEHLFGEPQQSIILPTKEVLNIYNYDINTKIIR